MSRTVADVNREQKEKFKTTKNKASMFKKGQRVRIICVAQDFRFFNGTETGVVTEEADSTASGMILVSIDGKHKDIFNFEADDLIHIDEVCKTCGQTVGVATPPIKGKD